MDTIENKGTLGSALDGEITNNSYWKSTGIALQQAICNMVTHNQSSFHFKTRFRTNTRIPTAFLIDVDRYGSTGNPREWNFAIVGSRLGCSIFGTNNGKKDDSCVFLMDSNYNDGLWHEVEVNWASNGVGLGGVFTYTVDGVTNTATSTVDTIRLTGLPLTMNGRVAGGSPPYACPFDIDYLEIADVRFNFSSCWGDKIYSTDGSQFFQLVNCVYSEVWKQDDQATPNNFKNGFYLYENDTPGEELRLPIQLEKYMYNGGGVTSGMRDYKDEHELTLKTGIFGVSKTIIYHFASTTGSPSTTSGYALFIVMNAVDRNVALTLRKYIEGAMDAQLKSTTAPVGDDVNIKIQRDDTTGVMNVFVDGILKITATDTTYSSSLYSFILNQRWYIKEWKIDGVVETSALYPLTIYGQTDPNYNLTGYIPPYTFGPMESGFKVPYNAIVAAADTENKLYYGTTPKEVKFTDLVAGGFGNKIKYVGSIAEGFRKFCVKK